MVVLEEGVVRKGTGRSCVELKSETRATDCQFGLILSTMAAGAGTERENEFHMRD